MKVDDTVLGPLRLSIYKSNRVANQARLCDAVFIQPNSLVVNDTLARVRITRTFGHCKTWFGSPKLLSGSGNTDFRLNGAKLRWVFSFPRKTVRIAVFPDKCIPDKRGFTVLTHSNIQIWRSGIQIVLIYVSGPKCKIPTTQNNSPIRTVLLKSPTFFESRTVYIEYPTIPLHKDRRAHVATTGEGYLGLGRVSVYTRARAREPAVLVDHHQLVRAACTSCMVWITRSSLVIMMKC